MKISKPIRLISQIFFFVVIALITWNHYLVESGSALPFIGSSSLHAICPFGGVATLVSWVTLGAFVQKIHLSSIVIMVIIMILSFLLGPVVCSYVCPLGSIQEWFSKIGKKIFKGKFNTFIPKKLDKILRYGRYGVLIFTVYLTTQSLKLIFLEVDPYYALFNFWSDEATVGGIIVLVIVLMGSLFVERPWCKYACPFGAVVGLTNYFSIFKIRRKSSTCVNCQKCDTVCPMNIQVSSKDVIKDTSCIRCGLCTSEHTCPIDNTVSLSIKDKEEIR